MVIERKILVEGWKALVKLKYTNMAKEAIFAGANVYISPHDPIKVGWVYVLAQGQYYSTSCHGFTLWFCLVRHSVFFGGYKSPHHVIVS